MGVVINRVFGKLNLFLNVFPLSDGFHPLESVFAPCFDIYDEISVSPCERGEAGVFFAVADFICETQSDEFLEKYKREVALLGGFEDNSAKALRLFCEKFGDFSPEFLRVEIAKGIPFLAGMGGSSADAVGVLKCLCEMSGRDFCDVSDIANAVGSDLAGMWSGGVNFCSGRGDIALEIAREIGGFAVVCTPDFGISTKEVFKTFDSLQMRGENRNFESCGAFQLENFDYLKNSRSLCNSLELSAFSAYPKMAEFAGEISRCGGVDFRMTGSGSGMFCHVVTLQKAVEISRKIGGLCSFCGVTRL